MTDETSTAIVVIEPAQAIARAKQCSDIVRIMRKDSVLQKDVDYGVIPGTNKPTLLKPGAEKLCSAFGLRPEFNAITVIEDFDKPLFYYRYECRLYHIETEKLIATAIGSCNSMESKYGFRWVGAHDIPPHLPDANCPTKSSSISEFDFAINKAETGGQWGKPQSYWDTWLKAIDSGEAIQIERKTKSGKAMKAWQLTTTLYRIPNEDIYSAINTIDKMAQKRSLIASTLIATNASADFTQDVEDMPGFGTADVVDAEFVDVAPEQKSPPEKTVFWTNERINGLFHWWLKERGLNESDVMRFAGITLKYNRQQWAKYESNQDASAAIQKAFNTELERETNEPPKTTEGKPEVYVCQFTHKAYEVAGRTCVKFANCDPSKGNGDLVIAQSYGRSTNFKELIGDYTYDLLGLASYDDVNKTTAFTPIPFEGGIELEYVEKVVQKGKRKGETYNEIVGVSGDSSF